MSIPMSADPITVSITRSVPPERAREAEVWAKSGQDLLAQSPGYLGSGWIRPDPMSHDWHMLYRFANRESLAAWEQSSERAWWIASAVGIAEDTRTERRTGIEGWFDDPRDVTVIDATPRIPARWKQMVSIFVAFYPLSLLVQFALSPFTVGWWLWFRVLVVVVISTPLMTFIFLPLSTRLLRPWLQRGARAR